MTDFLYDPGTNGFTRTPFNLLSTELNSLADSAFVVGSAGGQASNGVFSQTDFGSAIFGHVYFVAGGSFTVGGTAAGLLRGWYLLGVPDNSGIYEKSAVVPARAPDFIIPFIPGQAYAQWDVVRALGRPMLPAENCKILTASSLGVTLASSGNLLKCAPIAEKY